MGGSWNRFLEVDLDTGKTGIRSSDPGNLRAFVGGGALAARLFSETSGPEVDPFSPKNPLLLMAGPLVGTTFPGSSRFVLCARSPLTGIWGESSAGGFFGADLKKTGLDGVLISGRAEKPSYLLIEDDRVAIYEAGDLWGKDTYDTIDALKGQHPGKSAVKVLAIGPAGEHLVRYASVCHDKAHHLGRTGMGAVLGSKNLKAVAVRGSKKVPIAREEALVAARTAALQAVKESMMADSFHQLGTAAAMDLGMMTGDVPLKNWSLGVDYTLADALGGPALADKMVQGRVACYACPIGCKPVVESRVTPYAVPLGPGPEYETCAAFGTLIMNGNLYAVARANELCNRLGLDTISCGATMAFIMEAFEKGLLTRNELDGLEMQWGGIDPALTLIERIATRKGFGNRAAEGSRALARELGRGAEEGLVTVKGLELPMHDPRGFHGMGLAYMTSNRGACHLQHSVQAVEQGVVSWPEAGFQEDYMAQESGGKAEMVVLAENLGQMSNAVCVCHFVQWTMGLNNLLDGFNAVTGYDFDYREFLEAGRRSWVLKRALNNTMGVTAADDRLPKRLLTPLAEGGAAGSVPDEELMKKEYYRIRGLDEKGFPTTETLSELGLSDVGGKFKP
ncbi:MAG: aldehyde ferredoxin oxidoreductase family protein [Deltaproteobacteria bacterium]|nr:aldehyde ferredoxin oxidoreductase family protein [Deltaproteobacteria bacterium]